MSRAARTQQVELVVAVRGVVVEQRQALGAGFLRDVHRVVDRAVTPVALVLELGRRVLRVVDQQVDAVAEVEHVVGTKSSAVVGEPALLWMPMPQPWP